MVGFTGGKLARGIDGLLRRVVFAPAADGVEILQGESVGIDFATALGALGSARVSRSKKRGIPSICGRSSLRTGGDGRLRFGAVDPGLRHLELALHLPHGGEVLIKLVAVARGEPLFELFGRFVEGIQHARAVLEAGALDCFGRTLGIDEEGLKQSCGIVDGRDVNAGPVPAHGGAIAFAGIDGRITGDGSPMLRGHLIDGDILFGETGRLLLFDAAKKGVHSAVATADTVVEVRKYGEVASVRVDGLQRGTGLEIGPVALGKNPSGQKPRWLPMHNIRRGGVAVSAASKAPPKLLSSHGRARVTPTPRRKVRRSNRGEVISLMG